MTPGRDILSTQEHRDKFKTSSCVKSKGGGQKPGEQKPKSKGGEQKPKFTEEKKQSNLHHLDLASYQEIKKLLQERDLSEDTVLPTVQRLYDVCIESLVPDGASPSPQAVENISIVLDTIKGSDVGIHETNNPKLYSMQNLVGTDGSHVNGRNSRRHRMLAKKLSSTAAPVIFYLHLHECNTVSMGIFCLPATATIPLHNHPGMTVLSKLLYGSLRVKSYDWVEPFDAAEPSKPGLAKLVKEQVFTAPCKPEVLYPHGGNIHSLTALTPCAVLDVQAPPYSPSAGRHCIYFRASPLSSISVDISNKDIDDRDQNHVWLEEFEPPNGFVQRGVYHGPKIRRNDNVSIQAGFRGPSS